LPPLLKTLREGMENAGVPADKQDEHIQRLNNSLAAAFTAKAAVDPARAARGAHGDASRRSRNCCPKQPTSRSTNR
jgi:hypothetical protein